MDTQTSPAVTEETHEGTIEDKILHVLRVYPVLSWAMLRTGAGNHYSTSEIRTALDNLIADGRVLRSTISLQTPLAQRTYQYERFHLPSCPIDTLDTTLGVSSQG